MTYRNAVIHLSHESARIVEFDATSMHAGKIDQHPHATRQHGSGVRSEHEFFGSVCDRVGSLAKVLVTGGHTTLADFRHYVEKHRSLVAPHIVGYEVVDHLTDHQLVAMARQRFDELERLA
jgi:hypothetical protein